MDLQPSSPSVTSAHGSIAISSSGSCHARTHGWFLVHDSSKTNAQPQPHVFDERLVAFGQPTLIASENTNGIGVRERAGIQRLNEMSTNGLEKLMKDHQLDAIVAPNADASSVLAVGGNPAIAVPAGYNNQGVPYGICFGGLKGYEPRLIEMAYAFEQATKVRRPPTFRR